MPGSDVTVGAVNINLRLSLKQFSDDINKGKQQSQDGMNDMADVFNSKSQEAKASLALLGNEIGVSIPRNLRAAIVAIPGVGEALAAAFSSVAVLALIEVIVTVVKKVQDFKARVAEAEKAWDKVGESGQKAMRSLTEESIDLQRQIDVLNKNYVAALRDQFEKLNLTSLDKILAAVERLGTEADAAFKKLAVGGIESFFGLGNDAAVKNAANDLDAVITKVKELNKAQDNAGIGKLLDSKISELKSFVNVPFANDDHPEVRQQALQKELDTLTAMRDEYAKINDNAGKQKTVDILSDQARALRETNTEATRLYEQYMSLTKQTEEALRPELDGYQQREQKIQDLIAKWGDYKTAWEAAHKGISAIANGQMERLQQEMSYLDAESKSAVSMALTAAIAASKQAQDIKAIGSGSTNDKPVYGGTAEAMKLYEIQTDQNEAVKEGQKVFTDTRYASEEYGNQLAILNALLKAGTIDQGTYDRALDQLKGKFGSATDGAREFFNQFLHQDSQAKDTFDLLNKGLQGFQDNLAETLATGKANWADYFNDLDEMLLKMSFNTLFKDALGFLNDSSFFSGLGGGNIFGSGGVFGGGHADGGPVTPGHYYNVGERGTEKFVPTVPGYIVPNGGMPGDGGTTIQVVQNISTPNADSFGKSQDQLLSQALRRAAVSHARSR